MAGNESVAEFVPYRINSENMKQLDGLFEPKRGAGGQQMHDDIADLSYLFKTGAAMTSAADADDMTIDTESSWSTNTPRTKMPSMHEGLGMYTSTQDSFVGQVFPGSQGNPMGMSLDTMSEVNGYGGGGGSVGGIGSGHSGYGAHGGGLGFGDGPTRPPVTRGKAPSLVAASGGYNHSHSHSHSHSQLGPLGSPSMDMDSSVGGRSMHSRGGGGGGNKMGYKKFSQSFQKVRYTIQDT